MVVNVSRNAWSSMGGVAKSGPANVQRWVLRDRKPLKQWSKGRATIVGDAAHPTSPYAAYGAGMATEDGYFLGRRLAGVDLSDYAAVQQALQDFETPRKPHTARQVQQAYVLGKLFHHAPPPLQAVRDAILDHTPFLQKVVGESTPGEILKQLAEIDAAEEAVEGQSRRSVRKKLSRTDLGSCPGPGCRARVAADAVGGAAWAVNRPACG